MLLYGTIFWYIREKKGVYRVLANVLMIVDLVISVLLIASVLLQSGKSAGLSGIGGGGDSMFSGKPTDMDEALSRITIVLGIAFGIVTMIIAKVQ